MQPIPPQTRLAQSVALRHGYRFEILDEGEGYIFRISDGQKSFMAGAGSISSYPMNSAFATSISRDKVFTNLLLDVAGVENLGGKAIFLNGDSRRLRGQGYELHDAKGYITELGFPIFCKPLSGSRGDFAEQITSMAAFDDYVARCSKRHAAIVIQRFFEGTELRAFVFDQEVLFALEKPEVSLVGDGQHAVSKLLEQLNRRLSGRGISPYLPTTALVRQDGVEPLNNYVPARGERVHIPGRKNLGFGERPIPLEPIPEDLTVIALKAARAVGLRATAVDILRSKEGQGREVLRVIELNSNPEIAGLEVLERWDVIDTIWMKIIREGLS